MVPQTMETRNGRRIQKVEAMSKQVKNTDRIVWVMSRRLGICSFMSWILQFLDGPERKAGHDPWGRRGSQGRVRRGTLRGSATLQYLSGTNLLSFRVAWSSYLPLLDRLGSFTCSRGSFL